MVNGGTGAKMPPKIAFKRPKKDRFPLLTRGKQAVQRVYKSLLSTPPKSLLVFVGCVVAIVAVLGLAYYEGLFGGRPWLTAEQRRCVWDGDYIKLASGTKLDRVALPDGGSKAGLFVTKTMHPAGETVVSVPLDCAISLDNALGTELKNFLGSDPALRRTISEEIEKSGIEKLIISYTYEHIFLALLLLREISLGPKKSFLPDYILNLPKKSAIESPLLWSDGELTWLDGTLAGIYATQAKKFLHAVHARVVPILEKSAFKGSLDFQDFLHAHILVQSRHFSVSLTAQERGKEPVMVPVLDMINHCPDMKSDMQITNVTGLSKDYRRAPGESDKRRVVLKVSNKFLKGDEICYTYDESKNAEEFLFQYGFEDEHMPGAIAVLLSDLEDPEQKKKAVSPDPSSSFSSLKVVEFGKPVNSDLLCALRIRQLPPRQQDDAKMRTKVYGPQWCVEPLEDRRDEANVWRSLRHLYAMAAHRLDHIINMDQCLRTSPNPGECRQARFDVAMKHRIRAVKLAQSRTTDAMSRTAQLEGDGRGPF